MPSLSPQVQQFGDAPPAEQAEQLFKDKFTQIAYSVLFSKFADMAPDVVTFKILETAPDKGKGVGAFVILRDNKPIYVPAVMIDGQMKPMEMFYYKDLNIFLPLDNTWLDEVSKMSLDEMGESQEVPQDVPRDLNLQNVVTPPLAAGRYGFASVENADEHDHNIKKMFKEAEDHNLEIHPAFLNVMKEAPKVVLDGMKIAFEKHPPLLQKFAKVYGTTELVKAFQEGYDNIKEAAVVEEGTVEVFTKEATSKELKDAFGDKSGEAFSAILKKGYAVNDTRKGIFKTAVKVERQSSLDSPGSQGGWFRLYFADAPADLFFIIPWPKGGARDYELTVPRNNQSKPIEYLAINKDGKEAWTCNDIMGERIYNTDDIKDTKLYKLMKGEGGDTPTPDAYGFFLNMSNKAIGATRPFEVKFVVDSDGRKKVISNDYPQQSFIIDDNPSRARIDVVNQEKLVFLPKNVKWVEISKLKKNADGYIDRDDYPSSREFQKRRRTSIICDPKLLSRWLNAKLSDVEARKVNVKKAGLNDWWIEGSDRAYSYTQALQKVATIYEVSANDADGILKNAQEEGVSGAFILTPETGRKLLAEMEKVAQPAMPQPGAAPPPPMGGPGGAPMPPQGGAPGGPMPPGGDPMAMGGMAPPMAQSPMDPTDLAIAEVVDDLKQQTEMQGQQQQMQMQQQQEMMQMQQQQNEQLVGVLEHIQQRSREISGATGGVVPQGAEGAPATAAGMLAPPMQEEAPPPMPMMEGEATSPEMLADQINPELVDQASELQDAGTFDTAALAMLSTAPALQDIVSSYVPNMEKCLDNVGRILLTLWLTEEETKESIGDETYIMLEDKLRTIFKGLGDVILSLSHNAPSASNAQGYVEDGS